MFFPVSFMSKVYFPPDGLIHTPHGESGMGGERASSFRPGKAAFERQTRPRPPAQRAGGLE